ncbi:MAG: outer membrane protein assembly factor BamD [Acidobacteriota bacterium]|nr:MAG: outer membrane protein assembly factor BamD [Acidobacteriota bacterium]
MPRSRALWTIALLAAIAASGCARNRELIDDNELLYRKAREKIAKRQFLQAIELLGDVGLLTPVSETLDPKVKLAIADAYFYQGGTVNTIEAQNRYEQFLSFFPTHPEADRARYMIGLCLFRQAESPENDQEYSLRALAHFEAMIRELPADSPWQQPAREMLARVQTRLAEHEWKVAEFYFEGGHYAGTIGRLTYMIDRYPRSLRREEAMLRLAQAYRAVGDLENARASLERLLTEYAGGRFAQQAREMARRLEQEAAGTASQTALGSPAG